ncbi:MAG: hypothetical protein KDD27_17000, partial [Saprospiraceae bacterium]|nr:hypothetical protein [Saprospiraceae bacterium]
TYTDGNGCTGSCTFTVTVGLLDDASFSYPAASFCANGPNPTPTVTGLPGGTFTATPAGLVIGSATGTIDLSASTPGTYTVTYATNGACPNTASVQLTINAAPACSINGPALVCSGSTGNSYGAPAGMAIYAWSISGNGTITSPTNQQDVTVDAGGSGSYILTLTIVDGNGCSSTCSLTVNITGLSGCIVTGPDGVCANSTGIIYTAPAGLGSYAWSITGNGTIAGLANQQTVTVNAGAAGSFSLTLTISNGNSCSSTCSKTVTVNSLPVISAIPTNVSCNGANNGSIDISVSGGSGSGYVYDWLDIPGNNDTEDRSGLAPGTYSVIVTDGNGCSSTASVTITQPTALVLATTVTNVDCNGGANGAINLTVNGGTSPYTYDWADVAGTNNTEDRSGLPAGTYTVTVTDQNGCTLSSSATVGQPAPISITAVVANVSCNGDTNGSIDVTVSGGTPGYTYNWADLLGSNNPADRTGLAPGTYSVTVTDTKGCTATASFVVNEPQPIVITYVVTNVSCAGASDGAIDITVTGGTAPYTYDWADLAGPNNPEDRTNLAEATYDIKVTDANGCMANDWIMIMNGDSEPPTAICQNITVALDPNTGEVNITPAMINNGSSDNCGIANMYLSQTNFTCADVGTNTVTLTVVDTKGLTSTCTATVTIPSFITNIDIQVEDESCENYGDGTITISVDVPGGQPLYSIDGGATFNAVGFFEFLSPGVYNIVVQVQKTALCTYTTTATVNAGPPPPTWYLDWDDDGYHCNGVTVVSCTRPPGYKLASELLSMDPDCNDSDPTQTYGQVWYEDIDNDGYTTGDTLIQCLQPYGYKIAADLLSITLLDCNDNNAAIHPGATEICNGIDDNCDGQIDEGLANLTYNGNVVLASQADVDAWPQCYVIINGNLFIQNATITNLANLSNIIQVTGNVTIMNTHLNNMGGLDNLATIGGSLTIKTNGQLVSLDGLDGLTSVGNNLTVSHNFNLTDCCAIYDLINNGGVGNQISIFLNKTTCDSVQAVNTDCSNMNPLVGPQHSGSTYSSGEIFFDAQMNGSIVDLYWKVDAEYENDIYFVQKSTDGGMTYHIIVAELSVYGASGGSYLRADRIPVIGKNYYRLEIKHQDGTEEYSDVRLVDCKPLSDKVQVFPNPAADYIYLNLEALSSQDVEVKIVNQYGRQLGLIEVDGQQDHLLKIDFGKYPIEEGLYFIEYRTETGMQGSLKFYSTKRY